MNLRPYQSDLVRRFYDSTARRSLVILPTGGGKTRVAASMRGLPERMVRVEEKGTSSQLHDGIDDLFSGNRAGVDEAEMSRDEIAAELRASRGAGDGR